MIQSGWARARSKSGLTISGSTHRPNSMPRSCTCLMRGPRPCGHTSGSTYQSPRPPVSSRRPRNQPSSSTNRSTPISAPMSAGVRSLSRSWAKYTASQTLRTPRRGVLGWWGRARSVSWNLPASSCCRVRSSWVSASRTCPRGCTAPTATVSTSSPPARRRSPSNARSATTRWLPLQATCTPQTSPERKPKPAGPATVTNAASAPVRPCRPSRRCVPPRRSFVVGTHLREGRHGRTGADAAFVTVAGPAGFGFRSGEVWGVHVAWSGNHRVVAERAFDGERLLAGGELLLPGEVELGLGESYMSPWLYGSYGDGLDELAGRFHDTLRARPHHPRTPRRVVLNVWEAVYFAHDLDKLRTLADIGAEIGVERFVLDDGWFRGRRDDTGGLGDWYVDPEVWPHGLG